MSALTIDEYRQCLDGFNILDCAVRNRDLFYFVSREDYTKWPRDRWDGESEPPAEDSIKKRLALVEMDRPKGSRIGSGDITGIEYPMIEVSHKPDERGVLMTLSGHVFVTGGGAAGFEKKLETWQKSKGPNKGGVRKLRNIDGWVYFCMGERGVGKRLGKNEWLHYNDQMPASPDASDYFSDIDGFSEADIYSVGNAGNVWHFDGKTWRQLDFPSNIKLSTVVCAGDGQVYISGAQGTTFKGRGQRWQRIHEGSMSLPFKDMVWYEDRVWATSDYGVWHIREDRVERVELPEDMHAYAGNLSVGDGVLLLAGYGGAAFLRDGKWTRLFSAGAMQQELGEERDRK